MPIFTGLNITTSDTLAFFALIISVCNTIFTIRFYQKQTQLADQQKKLNSLMSDRESDEAADKKKASIHANIVGCGNDKKLVICNKGKSVARNVRIEFPNGNTCVMESDIMDKFPLKRFEPTAEVRLIIVQDTETKHKFSIEIHWMMILKITAKNLLN